MAKIAGKYQLEKNENFVQYLKDLGVPEDKAQKADGLKPVLEITVQGDKYTLNSDSGLTNDKSTFNLNEEYDDPMSTGYVLKSVANVDGNKLTITSKTKDGLGGTRLYEFTDKEAILTLTSTASSAVAKRVYKRI